MQSEFKAYSLLDVYDVTNGLTKSKKDFGFGYPFLTFKEVFNTYFLPDELLSLANANEKERTKCSIKKGDVFITRTSETIDELALTSVALKDYPEATFNGFTKRLRANGVVDINLVYASFYFKSNIFRNQVKAFVTMTTRASLNNEMLARLTIKLPNIKVQNKIAHILKTIHDKIELNRKMNQTLEEMAQALFKSWFVDFDPVHVKVNAAGREDALGYKATAKSEQELESAATKLGVSKEILDLFPSEFEESEMGMVPKGWEVKSIKDFGRVVTGKTPPKKIEDAYTDEGKPFITPTDIDESLFVTKTVRNLSGSGQKAVKNSEITAGSICVTCIGSQMGKTTVAPINSFTNQQINSIILREDYLRNYLLSNLRGRRKEIFLLGSGGGSTMPLLNKSSFEKVDILLPSKSLLEVFDSIVKDNIALVLQNDIENNSLSKTRDTLLPKLLSGELDVSKVHIGDDNAD